MKKLLLFLGALAAYAQTVSLSDTLTNAVGGGSFTGRVTVTLNSPGNASPLYYSTTSLTGWQAVYCIGVTGADCTTTTSAGAFAATLYANSTITPAGTSYSARFQPAKGAAWSETWTVEASDTKLYQVRSTTVPTPTVTFQPSQLLLGAGYIPYGASTGYGTSLAPGTNGHVLTLSAGYPSWATPAACAICVVTSGFYADPAWITSLAGSKVSGNISGNAGTATALAANPSNCPAGTFPLGVDASGASESCTALPTTITGTANQITASASTGAITLSLPATITGLTSVTSTGFTGALTGNVTGNLTGNVTGNLTGNVTGNVSGSSGSTTGNAATATALAATVPTGRLWIGNGTGAPTSDAGLTFDTSTKALVASGDLTLSTDGKAILSAAGTVYLKPSITNTEQYIQVSPTGTATITGFILKGQLSNTTGTRADILQSGADTIIRNQTLGAGAQGSITLEQSGSVRLKVFAATGNIAIGTTTDIGYGLAAQKTGATGTLLAQDPTSTTGFTRVLFDLGAADTASTEIFRINGTMRFGGTNTTGAGSAALGSNSPATTNTAPYTWIRAVTADGSTVYIPAWK